MSDEGLLSRAEQSRTLRDRIYSLPFAARQASPQDGIASHRHRYIAECRDLLTAAGLAAIPDVAGHERS